MESYRIVNSKHFEVEMTILTKVLLVHYLFFLRKCLKSNLHFVLHRQ